MHSVLTMLVRVILVLVLTAGLTIVVVAAKDAITNPKGNK